MSDVLGNALQRLSLAEPCDSTTKCDAQAAPLTEQSECCSAANAVSMSTSVDLELAAETVSVTQVAKPEPVRENWKTTLVSFLLSHRRQTAALVVGLCMIWIWFAGNASSNVTTAESLDQESMDMDSLLSEFDAVPSEGLREPAEPIETSDYGDVSLTIPQDGPAPAERTDAFSQFAAPSAAVAVYPDEQIRSSGTSPVSGSQQTPSAGKSVRFTGRIQPLN